MKFNLALVLSVILFTQAAFATQVTVTCQVSEISAGVESLIMEDTQTIQTENLTEIIDMSFVVSEPLTVKVSTYLSRFNNPISSKIDEVCMGGKCVEGGSDLYYKVGEMAQDELKVSCFKN